MKLERRTKNWGWGCTDELVKAIKKNKKEEEPAKKTTSQPTYWNKHKVF